MAKQDITGIISNVNRSTDHNRLTNRDAQDQHPIDAITGLTNELAKLKTADNQLKEDINVFNTDTTTKLTQITKSLTDSKKTEKQLAKTIQTKTTEVKTELINVINDTRSEFNSKLNSVNDQVKQVESQQTILNEKISLVDSKTKTICTELNAFKEETDKKFNWSRIADSFLIKQLNKANKYLFEIDYLDINYLNFNMPYYDEFDSDYRPGLCSSVRKGNCHGRNLDWYYHEDADFILRVPASGSNFGYVGMAYKTGLTPTMINSHLQGFNADVIADIAVLPFLTVDGINDAGLVINTNVVNRNDNPAPVPTVRNHESDKVQLDSRQVCNYILTHYATAQDAYRGFCEDFEVHNGAKVAMYGYEQHWMLSDKDSTYIIEIYNNEIRAAVYRTITLNNRGFGPAAIYINEKLSYYEKYDSKPDMYNFFRTTVTENAGGTINRLMNKTLGLYSSGIERNNLTAKWFQSLNADDVMMQSYLLNHMKDTLKFTNAYKYELGSDEFWYTEFVGSTPELLVNTPKIVYATNPVIQGYIEKYKTSFDRQHNFWQTVHSVVYDVKTKEIWLTSQEEQYNDGIYRLVYSNKELAEAVKTYTIKYINEQIEQVQIEFKQALEAKQNKLIPGEGVHLVDDVLNVDQVEPQYISEVVENYMKSDGVVAENDQALHYLDII